MSATLQHPAFPFGRPAFYAKGMEKELADGSSRTATEQRRYVSHGNVQFVSRRMNRNPPVSFLFSKLMKMYNGELLDEDSSLEKHADCFSLALAQNRALSYCCAARSFSLARSLYLR